MGTSSHPSAAGAGPILLCYDGSQSAREAIAVAGRLLAPAPATVLHSWLPLSHVLLWNPLVQSPGPLAEPAEELDAPGREAAERLTAEGVRLAAEAGFDATPACEACRHGHWRTVLRVADRVDARLLVLGTHGLSPFASGLPGSVAAGVVHHAERPVLVIPCERRR